MDLSTTSLHQSRLQVITALSIISTFYKSLQHSTSLFQPAVSSSAVSCQRLLTAEILQLHALRFYLQLTTNWLAPIVFTITTRHVSHRRHPPFSIVAVQLLQLPNSGLYNTVSNSNSIVVEACLPRRGIATAVVLMFVSRSLPSNGSIRHTM
jgi:hypothetical protein